RTASLETPARRWSARGPRRPPGRRSSRPRGPAPCRWRRTPAAPRRPRTAIPAPRTPPGRTRPFPANPYPSSVLQTAPPATPASCCASDRNETRKAPGRRARRPEAARGSQEGVPGGAAWPELDTVLCATSAAALRPQARQPLPAPPCFARPSLLKVPPRAYAPASAGAPPVPRPAAPAAGSTRVPALQVANPRVDKRIEDVHDQVD